MKSEVANATFSLGHCMHTALIRKVLARAQSGYFGLQVNQRLYVNAFVVLVAYLSASLALGRPSTKGLLAIFFAFWSAAVVFDLVVLHKRIYETVLGKALLVLLFGICTNVAIAVSSQLVNDIAGVDPSKFPKTVALLSILSIPGFIAAGFSILYFLSIIATPLIFMFQAIPDDKAKEVLFPGYSVTKIIPHQKITRVVQLISFAVFSGFVYSLSQKIMQSYETYATDVARSFLYELEMYRKAPCKFEQGTRVAFISDELVLVGTKKPAGVEFNVRECKAGGA